MNKSIFAQKLEEIEEGCNNETGKRVSNRWLKCGQREEMYLPKILCYKCQANRQLLLDLQKECVDILEKLDSYAVTPKGIKVCSEEQGAFIQYIHIFKNIFAIDEVGE